MIVLGVDPGSHATGYGVISTGPVVRMLGGGVIRARKGAPLSERLLDIHNALTEVIAEHNPMAMAVEDLLEDYPTEPDDTLDRFTWGDRNSVGMAHPMSGSLPGFLARRLNIEAEQLPGDAWMPRVQSSGWGASERFVVSPGRQDAGLLHMPGGQSGHPFSPFYRKGHRAWAEGAPTPFLPGETRHTLVLTP